MRGCLRVICPAPGVGMNIRALRHENQQKVFMIRMPGHLDVQVRSAEFVNPLLHPVGIEICACNGLDPLFLIAHPDNDYSASRVGEANGGIRENTLHIRRACLSSLKSRVGLSRSRAAAPLLNLLRTASAIVSR